MAFTLSGSTITQTGTDTSLAGLSGIAGVSTFTYGSGDNRRSIYNIGSNILVLSGALTINPYKEKLVHNGLNSVRFNGTLTVDGRRTINGTIFYSTDTWLESTRNGTFNSSNLSFGSSSSTTLYGGRIFCPSGFRLRGTVNATNIVISTQQYSASGNLSSSQKQIRLESPNISIDGMITENSRFAMVQFPAQLDRYQPKQMYLALSFSSSSPNSDLILNGYDTDGSHLYDVALWGGNRTILRNAAQGSAIKVGPNTSRNSSSYGIVLVQQEFNPVIAVGSGPTVEGAKLYFTDYDNGGRVAYTRENYLTTPGLAFDTTTTKTYTGTLTSGGNLASNLEVVTAVVAVEAGNTNTGLQPIDHRSKNNDATDEFEVFVASYGHGLTSFSAQLKGVETVTSGTTVFEDLLISESDRAVVDAYTALETPEKIYDRAKSNLVANYVGESQVDITRSGSSISAPVDIAFDSTAVDVYSSSSSVRRIKTPLYTGSASSTVLLENGSLVAGGTFDRVVLVSGFTGTVDLANTTIATLENRTGQNLTITGATVSSTVETSGTLTVTNDMVVTFSGLTSDTSVYVASNVQQLFVSAPGTTETLNIPRANDGETWTYVIKRPGYAHQVGSFLVVEGSAQTIEAVYSQKLNADGTPMLNTDTSSLVSISIPGTTNAYIDIGDGTVPMQAIFNASEAALATQAGMVWLASGKSDLSQFSSIAGDFLFLTTGWRLRRAASGDTNATIGAFAQGPDSTVLDESNGTIRFLTTNTPDNVAQAVTDQLQALGVLAGGGSRDWTDAEKEEIRSALGVTGTKTTATGGQLQAIPTTAVDVSNLATSAEIAALNDLSAQDVLTSTVEGSETLEQAIRLIRASAAGTIEQASDGSYVIKSADGNIDRVVGSLGANNGRTVDSLDAS